MDVERRKAAFRSSVDEDSFVEFFDWMAADGRQLISASPVPLYHQLADLLRSWVAVAARPGAKVPTEQQLSEKFRVSRATVQKAFDLLSYEGLISRAQGRGTFVDPHKVDRPLALRSLWDDLVEAGRQVTTEVISRTVNQASGEARVRLRLREEDQMIVLVRLRKADERPFALLRNWLPLQPCRKVIDADLAQVSLYRVMEKECGLLLLEAEEAIGARRPIPSEVEHLQLSEGEPVLYMTRQTFTSEGRPVEWADHAYPASATQFHTTVRSGMVQPRLLATRRSSDVS